MSFRHPTVVRLAAILITCTQCAMGAESWSDPKLTTTEGLALWLDATKPIAGERPRSGDSLARWQDASGNHRDVIQEDSTRQPQWIATSDAGFVRFDGESQFLRQSATDDSLENFTLFMVAAPQDNTRPFQSFLAFNAKGQRDYTSGLTVDLGPVANRQFQSLNIEGIGFGGAENLRSRSSPFKQLQFFEIQSEAGKSIDLTINGQLEKSRIRTTQLISLQEITLGARYYNNASSEQLVQGFLRCDIAEVIVFRRLLSETEMLATRGYLENKYQKLKSELPRDTKPEDEPFPVVENPPAIQLFQPGFEVQELPIDLTNVNNVKYRDDGTLVALGYDGRIWYLSDQDHDGAEETSTLFWDNSEHLLAPIGMDLTPPDYPHGDGVFVIGKSGCLLVVDTDHDRVADRVMKIASGWTETKHPVDALGIAFDRRDGSVYFGRGSANFTNPLLLDSEGTSHYALDGDAGTIQRIAPDFGSRTTVATGIRFPVAIRLNRLGDLFCTDQEGATWVPNGNPFDELLHVERGRHYGFPPRHPKHLPNVIDEPSTFDYAPQHQSTCGLNFNDPLKANGPTFGPHAWAGDAIVTGYSRGKLYRTKLTKTAVGYVAMTQLFGSTKMLAVDACVGPLGELVVACHSGGPDWGSGPTGTGKLFKIRYQDQIPQPVFAWAANPRELRIEFDRAIEPLQFTNVLKHLRVTAGPFVRAGDQFESLWPGYAIVQSQKSAPRKRVSVFSAQLMPNHRTLILATDPMMEAVGYSISLPTWESANPNRNPRFIAPQHPSVDLEFNLHGCEVEWTPMHGGASWKGWLPHADLHVSRVLTAGSDTHNELWESLHQPGVLHLTTLLDVQDLLRPAVQPGSKLDYEFPFEVPNVQLTASSKLQVRLNKMDQPVKDRSASINIAKNHREPILCELTLVHSGGELTLNATWNTQEDVRFRPFPLRRFLLPWSQSMGDGQSSPSIARPKEIAGGRWSRGRKIFFSDQAACSKCHALQGQGGAVGPDLSNLVHRDYASVLRDIVSPSFAINPDHLASIVLTRDGQVLTGIARKSGEQMLITDAKGITQSLPRDQIEEVRSSSLSIMPEGLIKDWDADRLRDLMTFLLTPPPQMPQDGNLMPPKRRSLKEVQDVVAGAESLVLPRKSIKLVLVAGPKDHGPGEHDYPAWQKVWEELLGSAEGTEVETAWEWPTEAQFQTADAMVFYQHGDWNEVRARSIDTFLSRGGGLTFIHWAVDGRQQGNDFARRIGLAAQGAVGFRHGAMRLDFNQQSNHPLLRNLTTLELFDESYWNMVGELPAQRLLATAVEESQPRPQVWTLEHDRGRVFVSIPGHYSWTFDDPLFRILLLRGIAWTAHESIDRFNDLVLPGTMVK